MNKIDKIVVNEDNTLMSFAWPGGYPIVYLDSDNSILCPDCATDLYNDPEEFDNFKPCDYFIHWEGRDMYCEQCNDLIESAYGIPE